MCGLFGFIDLEAENLSPSLIEKGRLALHTLKHRGPDQWHESIENNVYMGHRRLSILDLSDEGLQPMITRDGQVAITVNGEIYNYQSIKKNIDKGQFRSQSDSEIILHGYREMGMGRLLEEIDGMYAMVIHDRTEQSLHLVRDRCGIKPLYYARLGSFFAWASELKALQSFFAQTGLLKHDKTALYDFLTYGYIPAPKSLYEGIYKLKPAQNLRLKISNKSYQLSTYWTLDPTEINIDHNQAAEHLRALISESVEEQMMSDVPLGFFLSGGIDSSIIISSAAQKRSDISTFSIGFDHAEHDETHYAEEIAQQFKTHQHTEIIKQEDNLDFSKHMLAWYDEPFADNSAIASYNVSKLAKKQATVVLTGDGGDEIFGGYGWYNWFHIVRKYQRPFLPFSKKGPSLTWGRGKSWKAGKWARKIDLLSHFDPLELYSLLLKGARVPDKAYWQHYFNIPKDYDDYWYYRPHYRTDLPSYKRLQYLDFHTFLPDQILTKIDRVTMRVSLEARVPFLSRKIVEYGFSLPQKIIYKNKNLKGCLQHAYKNILPHHILHRPKKGFSIPIHIWMDKQLQENGTVEELIMRDFLTYNDNEAVS